MNALADRRAVIGAIPASGACLPSWAQASEVFADPVYAAIEAHRRAYDGVAAWDDAGNQCELWERRETDPDAAAKLRHISDTQKAADEDTFNALLATKPTHEGRRDSRHCSCRGHRLLP